MACVFQRQERLPKLGEELSFLVFERLRVLDAEVLEAVFEAGFRVEAPIEQPCDVDIDFV